MIKEETINGMIFQERRIYRIYASEEDKRNGKFIYSTTDENEFHTHKQQYNLNCRRSMPKIKSKPKSSKYIGVSEITCRSVNDPLKWKMQYAYKGQRITTCFEHEKDAAKAYDRCRIKDGRDASKNNIIKPLKK